MSDAASFKSHEHRASQLDETTSPNAVQATRSEDQRDVEKNVPPQEASASDPNLVR